MLFAVVVLGGGAVGVYLRSRLVWILVIAFHVVNMVGGERPWDG